MKVPLVIFTTPSDQRGYMLLCVNIVILDSMSRIRNTSHHNTTQGVKSKPFLKEFQQNITTREGKIISKSCISFSDLPAINLSALTNRYTIYS